MRMRLIELRDGWKTKDGISKTLRRISAFTKSGSTRASLTTVVFIQSTVKSSIRTGFRMQLTTTTTNTFV